MVLAFGHCTVGYFFEGLSEVVKGGLEAELDIDLSLRAEPQEG